MKPCELLNKNLFAYAEKELPPALMLQLDRHVSECVTCNRMVNEFKSVMALMEEQKSTELRPYAETRILQGIENRMEKLQNSKVSVFTRVLQPAMISAGVVIALSIGFFIGSDFAASQSQYSQNEDITESVRTDLNAPEFMTDDMINFTE